MSNNPNIITSYKEVKSNYDSLVTIEGIYKQMNVSKRPGTETYSGRAYIDLGEGTIALERQEKGVRDKGEIQKYENKKVRVTGKLTSRQVLWGSGLEASIVSECIVDIKSIEEVK